MHETIERYQKHTKEIQANNPPVEQNMQVVSFLFNGWLDTLINLYSRINIIIAALEARSSKYGEKDRTARNIEAVHQFLFVFLILNKF